MNVFDLGGDAAALGFLGGLAGYLYAACLELVGLQPDFPRYVLHGTGLLGLAGAVLVLQLPA